MRKALVMVCLVEELIQHLYDHLELLETDPVLLSALSAAIARAAEVVRTPEERARRASIARESEAFDYHVSRGVVASTGSISAHARLRVRLAVEFRRTEQPGAVY